MKRPSLITWKNSEKVVELLAKAFVDAIETTFRDEMLIKDVAKYQDTFSQQDVEWTNRFWGKNTVGAKAAYNSGAFVCGLASVSKTANAAIADIESLLLKKATRRPKYGDVSTRHVKPRRQRKRGPKKKKSE